MGSCGFFLAVLNQGWYPAGPRVDGCGASPTGKAQVRISMGRVGRGGIEEPWLQFCRALEAWPFKENRKADKKLLGVAVSGDIPTGPPA